MITDISPIEVLVIDDMEDFAKECKDFLIQQCKIGAAYALNLEQAKEKLHQYPIKIVLLDYDMPGKNGLDVFPELKRIDSNLKIVFLSAVDLNKLGDIFFESIDLKFDEYLSKINFFKKLPQIIPTLLLKYSNSFDFSESELFYTERIRFLSIHKLEYSIIHSEVIDEEYISENSWITYNSIKKGEKISESYSAKFELEKKFKLSESLILDSDFNIGISDRNMTKYKSQLSNSMENIFKSEYTEKIRETINWIKSRNIDSNNENEDFISRDYEFARIYKQTRVIIKKHCTYCNSNTITPVTVYFPTTSIKFRICENYKDKEPKILYAGTHKN